MKKMLLIITTLTVVLSLASCSVLDDVINGMAGGVVDNSGSQNGESAENGGNAENNGDTENGENKENEENEENEKDDNSEALEALNKASVWYPYSDLFLITEYTGSWRTSFVDEFTNGTLGVTVISSSDAKPKRDHEIVIGQSLRDVSRLAYEKLEALITDDGDEEGYVIYVYDGSIAIAYSSEAAMKQAVSVFLEKCLLERLNVPNGVLLSDFYSLREMAEANREKMYTENLKKIKDELIRRGADNADAIISGIEKLYTLYGTDMLTWLANLYDVENGGFYYSDSGRDNFGYLPDLESTGQAFAMLDRSGLFSAFGGLSNHGIPEFMRESLLSFVRNLQSSEDGFFYHPQWGTAIASSRRSRDLDNAKSLLGYLRENPYYDDPSGRMSGIYGAPGKNAVKPVAYLTSHLGSSANFSAVMPTASNLPYYLQSIDAWANYLEKLNVSNDSYSVGNTLCSDWALIKAAGKEYVEYVINHLNERQIPETGLWEYNNPDNDYDPTDGIGFNGTNGLMKISVLYGSLGYAVPNAYQALKSAIKVGLYKNTGAKEETVCYVLNIWTCLNGMISNVKQHDKANYESARALLIENVPELLDSSYDILKTHLMPDGGFSYREVSAMNISQGALVGYSNVAESDINATMVATSSTVGAMLGALEVSGMPIWGPDDYYLFMRELESVGPVVKNPKDGFETFTDGNSTGNVTLNLKGYSSSVSDGALKISSSGNVTGGSVNVKMQYASSTGRKAHFLESHIKIDDAALGDVLTLDFKTSGGKVIVSLTLECYSVGGEKRLRLKDTYAGADGQKNVIIDGLALGEWHQIRLIAHQLYSSSYSVKTKVIVNNKYITTTDSSAMSGSAPLDGIISSSAITIVGKNVELQLDNLYSEKNYTPYS